jgi:hypothetical protein
MSCRVQRTGNHNMSGRIRCDSGVYRTCVHMTGGVGEARTIGNCSTTGLNVRSTVCPCCAVDPGTARNRSSKEGHNDDW